MENAGDSRGWEGEGELAIAGVIPGATQGLNQHLRGIIRRRRAEVRLGVIFLPILPLELLRSHAEIGVRPILRHQYSGRGGARGGDECRRIKRAGAGQTAAKAAATAPAREGGSQRSTPPGAAATTM